MVETPDKTEKAEKEDSTAKFKSRVRVLGVILDGSLSIKRAISRIKGIGPRISEVLLRNQNLDKKRELGSLNDKEISEIEAIIQKANSILPQYMLNHRNETITGKELHLTGSDLDLQIREDINMAKEARSYKGVRHSLGLPVRGQRTRTSFRKGRAIGVTKQRIEKTEKEKEKSEKKPQAAKEEKDGNAEKAKEKV